MKINNPNSNLLVAENLTIGYRKVKSENRLLSDLNLTIRKGEIISLMGPNGSGKSTLIKTLAGLLEPLKGNIQIKGNPIQEMPSSLKSELMGVVLTEPVFEKNLTVYDIVSLGRYQFSGWLGRIEARDRDKIEEAIIQVGLKNKIHNRLLELSDGEKQRVLIAKVLTQDVDLIILDEPTSHLDLPNRMELLLLLRNLAHKMGKGILLSTHELSLAMQISDKIWLIDRQSKLHQTLPEELVLTDILNATFGNDYIHFLPQSFSFELTPKSNFAIHISGKGRLTSSVVRLIKRLGFILSDDVTSSNIIIDVEDEGIKTIMLGIEKIHANLESLQEYLITNSNE